MPKKMYPMTLLELQAELRVVVDRMDTDLNCIGPANCTDMRADGIKALEMGLTRANSLAVHISAAEAAEATHTN